MAFTLGMHDGRLIICMAYYARAHFDDLDLDARSLMAWQGKNFSVELRIISTAKQAISILGFRTTLTSKPNVRLDQLGSSSDLSGFFLPVPSFSDISFSRSAFHFRYLWKRGARMMRASWVELKERCICVCTRKAAVCI